MTRFEYRSCAVPANKRSADVSELNTLGEAGWEAFAAVSGALDGYAYAETDGLIVLLRRGII